MKAFNLFLVFMILSGTLAKFCKYLDTPGNTFHTLLNMCEYCSISVCLLSFMACVYFILCVDP